MLVNNKNNFLKIFLNVIDGHFFKWYTADDFGRDTPKRASKNRTNTYGR